MITSTERAEHTAYMAELTATANRAEDRERVLFLRLQTFQEMLSEDGSDGTSTPELVSLFHGTQEALRAAEKANTEAQDAVDYAMWAWAEVEQEQAERDVYHAELIDCE